MPKYIKNIISFKRFLNFFNINNKLNIFLYICLNCYLFYKKAYKLVNFFVY